MSPGFSGVRMAEFADQVVVALAVDPKVKKRLRSNELADLKPGGR
jgi:hypothetical protein